MDFQYITREMVAMHDFETPAKNLTYTNAFDKVNTMIFIIQTYVLKTLVMFPYFEKKKILSNVSISNTKSTMYESKIYGEIDIFMSMSLNQL